MRLPDSTIVWDGLLAALRRPLLAGGLLLAVYMSLALLLNPGGYLGTDTGAKVATLEVMSQRSTLDPDVGYWADELDPDGRLHPLYQAQPTDEGGWVAVTTLPVLIAALPLYEAGGYRATLLLPMLGAVGAAFAARAVARRIDRGDAGWTAFWVVGLASPIAVYALDFWEHSIGVACMVGAAALLLDAAEGRGGARAGAAGALLGAAAVLRTESIVYAAVLVGAALITVAWRGRGAGRAAGLGLVAVVGFAVPWFANVFLEAAVSAPTRGARAVTTATGLGDDIGRRVEEGLQTSVGLNAGDLAAAVIPGAAVVLVVVAALRAAARGDRRFARVALGAAAMVIGFDALGGLGFVPGLLLAFPIAIAALAVPVASARGRLTAAGAVAALPLVYLVQYTGGAAPQWGGRYTLTSAVLLGVVGVAALREHVPWLLRGMVAVSVLVTGLGVAWLSVRSHQVDRFFDDLVAEAEPLVISRNAFLLREGGAVSVGRRWLTVDDEVSFRAAIAAVAATGERRFSVLEWDGEAPPAVAIPSGVREVARQRLTFVDVPVGLVTYELAVGPR